MKAGAPWCGLKAKRHLPQLSKAWQVENAPAPSSSTSPVCHSHGLLAAVPACDAIAVSPALLRGGISPLKDLTNLREPGGFCSSRAHE